MRARFLPALLLSALLPVHAEAQEAFAPGTYGEPFVLVAKIVGCYDDKGLWTCEVAGEGLILYASAGSRTPDAIIEYLSQQPQGTEILIGGDMIDPGEGRRMVVFSWVDAAPEGGDASLP